MDNTFETELILKGLYRDRDELAGKLNDVEKLIRKIKSGNFALNTTANNAPEQQTEQTNTQTPVLFPFKSEMKFQVAAIIDMIGTVCKLKDIQEKYKEITGSSYSVRETIRTLHKHKVVKILRSKGADRGVFWLKRDWLDENGKLMNKHKFYGFDLLYTDDNIEFE